VSPTDAIPTEAVIRGLFDGRAAAAVSEIDQGLDALHPDERAQMAAAVAKRQREFAAGRICARRLLRQLDLGGDALLSDDDRVPRWPEGVVGSITHSAGQCAVAVARSDTLRAIGLDLERADAVRPELWRRIFRPSEIERLHLAPAELQPRLAALAFSAKEATYKCLFPESRVALGLRDVEVEVDLQDGRFRVRLHRDVAPLAICGSWLEGRLAVPGPWVVTGLALPQSP
jgi:4'-phosphopantetheinyl transferase EntD